MPTKITRDESYETNKTTALWLYEFGHDLDKKANAPDYLKQYLEKNYKKQKFSSIEEKLADIKRRVGFEIATKITNELEKTSSSASSESSCGCPKSCKKCKGDCNCGKKEDCGCSVKTAAKNKSKKKKDPKDIEIMDSILKYIKDMVNDKPHLDPLTILSKCREDEALKYNNISKKIDHEKLMKYIEKIISSKEHSGHDHMVYYIPTDQNSLADSHIDIAEYYNHAEPRKS